MTSPIVQRCCRVCSGKLKIHPDAELLKRRYGPTFVHKRPTTCPFYTVLGSMTKVLP